MNASTVRRIDRLCAFLLVAYVAWVLIAFPWLANVYCERNAAVTLRRLTIVAELGIFVPYTWMPVSLVLTWRAARARPEAKTLVLYGAFIALCGLTHFVAARTIPWAEEGTTEPSRLYWLAMKLKTVTAAVSMAVARVTDQQKAKILALSNQEAELIRERDDAKAARALAEARAIELEEANRRESEQRAIAEEKTRAEAQQRAIAEAETRSANQARAELATVNASLAAANSELERARAAESQRAREQTTRAGTAEARNEELERMLAEIRAKDAELHSKNVRIEAQSEALRTLRTPILMPLDRVLVSVLIGALDSAQAGEWMERLLERIKETGSRLIIFDMTELSFIDSGVAQLIIKTANGVSLLGAKRVICGMQPLIAMTIVAQGIDLSALSALPTLREAIEMVTRKAAT